MITVREIAYSVYGAWRLAHLDPRGMEHFNTSLEGFWRSFFAAVIVAPAQVAIILIQAEDGAQDRDPLSDWLVTVIAYVVSWTAWPLIMFHVAQAIDRSASYLRYVVAYNWAQVIGAAALLIVAVVAAAILPPGAMKPALFMTWMTVLAYVWFIARTALGITGMLAAGLVVIDFFLTVVIGSVAAAIG